jgi:hypothetical protein
MLAGTKSRTFEDYGNDAVNAITQTNRSPPHLEHLHNKTNSHLISFIKPTGENLCL